MIRPITCVCFLLACGSGLYLYQSKHRVQVMDRQIEKTVHDTDTLREQTRVLHAEWTLLNDPQRLQALAAQFLSLKTVSPSQFTSMAELDNRLPAVRAPEPPPPEPVAAPVAQAAEPLQVDEPDRLPTPAIPPASVAETPRPVSVAAVTPPRIVERKPAPPRPEIAQAAPPRPEIRPTADIRPVAATESPRPPAAVPQAAGSMLGMARGTYAPLPRPMPVNASQWTNGGSGGG
jgi:hypothetical protein